MRSRRTAALIIGIGQYARPSVRPLRCARYDAEETYNALRDADCGDFQEARTKLLVDEHATREQLTNALTTWLPNAAKDADLALLYFAGHGVEIRGKTDSRAYLVPFDGDPNDAPTWCIALDDVRRWIGYIEARAVVAIFDCCHAGWVAETMASARSVDLEHEPIADTISPRHLDSLAGSGRCVLSSCGPGQQSWEYEELQHGLFTHHLLHGLRGKAQDELGRVEVTRLFYYVAEKVKEESSRTRSRQQEPQLNAQLNGHVYLTMPTATGDDHAHLLAKLHEIGTSRRLHRLPLVMRCLEDRVEAVQEAARGCLRQLGWRSISKEILSWASAEAPKPARVEVALDTFSRIPIEGARSVLAKLVARLTGDLHMRAARILDKYQFEEEQQQTLDWFNNIETAYRVTRSISHDAHTALYHGQHDVTQNPVTIRVLRKELARDPAKANAFLAQAALAYRYGHPNLLTVKDVVENSEDHLYYVVREFEQGRSLRARLHNGDLDARGRLLVLRQTVRALASVHRCGFGHGAVRPSNIFVDDKMFAKLGDLRLVLPNFQPPLADRTYEGRYTAPEAFSAGNSTHPASDFYSLGCVAYELHWDEPPFSCTDDIELAVCHSNGDVAYPQRSGALPPTVVDLLQQLLVRRPEDRLVDADRVDDYLGRLLEAVDHLALIPRIQLQSSNASDTAGWATSAKFDPSKKGTPTPSNEDDAASMTIMQSRPPWMAAATHPEQRVAPQSDMADLIASLPEVDGLPFADPAVLYGRIGHGGTAVVFRGRHRALGIPVAIKFLRHDIAADKHWLNRFLSEAQLAAKLAHDNLVRVYDVRNHRNRPYIVLEYVEGASCEGLIQRRGALPTEECVDLIAAAGRGLSLAHSRGIVHRDIKPGNILVALDGTAKLTDLGIAGLLGVPNGEDTGTYGTAGYMPPEQWQGIANVGPSGDVFSLGVTALHLLTGQRPPIDADCRDAQWIDAAWHKVDAPKSLVDLLRRCTARNPADRPTNAAEFMEALEDLSLTQRRTQVPRVTVRAVDGKPLDAVPMGADCDLLTVLIEKGIATDRHEQLGGRCQQLYACKSGMCGLCISRVVSGSEHLSPIGGREARSLKLQLEFLNVEQNRGLGPDECRLTCQARHVGSADVVIDLLGNTDANE